MSLFFFFFFSSRRRHTRWTGDWSSDVCSSDLAIDRQPRDARAFARLAKARRADSAAAPHPRLRRFSPLSLAGGRSARGRGRVRSEERRVGKGGELGGGGVSKKKRYQGSVVKQA